MVDARKDWATVCHRATALSPDEGRLLEERLRTAPDDLEARVKLIGHYFLSAADACRRRRGEHIVWLARHRPEINLGGYAFMVPEQAPEAFAEAKAAWIEAVAAHPSDVELLESAASFLCFEDPALAETVYRSAAALRPDDEECRERIAHTLMRQAGAAGTDVERIRYARMALDELEEALRLARDDVKVLGINIEIARTAVSAELWERATAAAERVLADNETCRRTFRYGNAVHWANIALGFAALARGDIAGAARFLATAAKTPGSPQLDSFGPDRELARKLLAAGERRAVLEYLERCKTFWSSHTIAIDRWTSAIERGEQTTLCDEYGTADDTTE